MEEQKYFLNDAPTVTTNNGYYQIYSNNNKNFLKKTNFFLIIRLTHNLFTIYLLLEEQK